MQFLRSSVQREETGLAQEPLQLCFPAGEGEGKLSMMQRVPKITEINLPIHVLQDCHGDAQIQERSTCAGTD